MVGVTNIRNNGRKKILVLGNTGDGKSTLCNILSGFDPNNQKIFPVSAGAVSCTQETKFEDVFFNGNKENPVSLIDTIGWSDSGKFIDAQIIEELITKLKYACDHVSLFLLVINGENPRLTSTNIEMFQTFMGMFTKSFLDQVVIIFTRWGMSRKEVTRRLRSSSGQTDRERAHKYLDQLKTTFNLEKIPSFLIINSHYDPLEDEEQTQFNTSMSSLYQKLLQSPNIPTINVEKVKTENLLLMERLAQYEAERSKIREEIARKAKELEKQAAKDKQNQEMQQKALEAMNEHVTKKEQEYNKKYGAQGPTASAAGLRAEACVGEAWVGDPILLGARGPAAAAGLSNRGLEIGAHAGEVTAAGFSARAGVKFGASDGQLHLGPVSAPCSIQ